MRISVAVVVCGLATNAAAEPDPIAPELHTSGNLRVRLQCADYFATPETGLAVSLDGAPLADVGTNGETFLVYNKYGPSQVWEPTDVGYVAAPGRHRVVAVAPGCAPDERDLVVEGLYPKLVTGRLAIADDSLRGPVGAPNGFGLVLGAWTLGHPAHAGTSQDFWGGTEEVAQAASSAHGVWMSFSRERRNLVIATDLAFAWGSTRGTVRTTVPAEGMVGTPGALPFTGTVRLARQALRVGARLPLRVASLEAGSGIGGDAWLASRDVDTKAAGGVDIEAESLRDSLHADWYVPVWAALTVKPSCTWGVQLYASYDVHPTARDESGVQIAAGLVIQPSAACEEAPGVRVTPP